MSEDIIRELEQSWLGSGLEDPKYSNPDDYYSPVEVYTYQIAMRGTRLDGTVVKTSRVAPCLTTNKEKAQQTLSALVRNPDSLAWVLSQWDLEDDEPFDSDCDWECVGIRLVMLCNPPF